MTQLALHLSDSCIVNPPPEPAAEALDSAASGLLALFVPKLIDSAIGGIATALKKAGDEETEQVTGEAFADFYVADAKQALSINPELRCLIGVWYDMSSQDPPDDQVVRDLKRAGLVPSGCSVKGIFEAMIRPMSDGTAFYLDSRYFAVRDFIGTRRKAKREYIVTVSVSTPDATAEGGTFALGKLQFGERKKGDHALPMNHPIDALPQYRSNLMPWSKISETSKVKYERDVGAGTAGGKRYMPVTFSLTVSETADGNIFLLKLGEILGGVAEKAGVEISKKLIPAEVEKAAAEEAARAEKLYEEELKAEMEVRTAQKAYETSDESDKPALRVALVLAERRLEWHTKLRQAAGLPSRPPVDSN